MPSHANCPCCGLTLIIPDSLQGRRVACGRCGQTFQTRHSATDPLIPLGQQVGERYEVLGELGRGTTSIVYHARDRRQGGREVVIKMLRPEVRGSAEALQRLRFEAEILAPIAHPHILPVLDHGLWQDLGFIVFPHLPGVALKEVIPPKGLPVHRAVSLTLKVVRTLDHLWKKHGLLHRDIKPGNILLLEKEPDSLYLVDFGLAGRPHIDSPRRQPAVRTILGTPAYLSPEQARGDLTGVGHSADLYSAGVVLYQLLTGTVPFPAPYPAVLSDIRNKPIPPPSAHRPGLDPGLESIVLRALARHPQQRYASGQVLAEALEEWLRTSQPAPITPPGGHRGKNG